MINKTIKIIYIILVIALSFSSASIAADDIIPEQKIECIPMRNNNFADVSDNRKLKIDSYEKDCSKNAYRYLLVPGQPAAVEAKEFSEMILPNKGKTAETIPYIPKSF